MYIETSYPRVANDNAKLEINQLGLGSGKTCISFQYYMLGANVNRLNVYVNNKQQFAAIGNHGHRWNEANFTVNDDATSVSIQDQMFSL